jgi:hypothetical protein
MDPWLITSSIERRRYGVPDHQRRCGKEFGVEGDHELFVDDAPAPAADRGPSRRRTGLVAALVAVLVVAGVTAGLVVAGGSPKDNSDAVHRVVAALSATTGSGSFAVSYHLSSTPATQTPAISSTPSTTAAGVPCIANGSTAECTAEPNPDQVPVSVSGSGTIDTGPKASVVSAVLTPQSAINQLTLRVDSRNVYEDLGSLDTGLAPPPEMANAPAQAMPGFAPVTEQVLGPREGAVAMLGIASPDGYLDLAQAAITGASETGTSTKDGVPVTDYLVSDNPSQLVGSNTLSPEESQSVSDAVKVLDDHGYTHSTVDLSIDGAGFIRSVSSVTHFSDGSTVVLAADLSNFGCAGTVLMPGQTGPDTPPLNCSSPDAAVTGTTGTTAESTPSTTTSSQPTTTVTTCVAIPLGGFNPGASFAPSPGVSGPISGGVPDTTTTTTCPPPVTSTTVATNPPTAISGGSAGATAPSFAPTG